LSSQVAVAVVKSVGGAGSAATRAERFAKAVHDSWGVGDACGSGILLLVATEDRQARPSPPSLFHGTLGLTPPLCSRFTLAASPPSPGVHQHRRERVSRGA
jgi:hypothetical protein